MSKGPKNQTTTQQQVIPEYLKPFLTQAANTGSGALNALSNSASSGNLVAPFNAAQTQGQNAAIGVANGAGGYIPDALRQIQGTVNGSPQITRMADIGSEALAQGATQNVVGQQAGTLNSLSGIGGIPGAATNALTSSANGDYLFGSPAFNEAVNASIRQARPQILGGFAGQGGAGAVSGGLAQIGMQQAASDAFARLYDSERNRQVGAASNLGSLSLQDLSRQAQAAQAAGGMNLAQQGNNIGAASNIGSLLNDERNRQFNGALSLPGLSMAGPDILNQVGGFQQNQAQNEIDAPINAHIGLYNASMDGLQAPQGLLGQQTNTPLYRNRLSGGAGGVAAGAKAGSMFGPWGTAIGAIGGGLLGAFG